VELGDAAFAARTRHYLGYAALLAGDHMEADRQFRLSLGQAWLRQEPTGIAEGLAGLAAANAAAGRDALAAQLAAVAATWREEAGVEPHAFDRAVGQRFLHTSRVRLGDAAWTAACAAGRVMPMTTAVKQALRAGE
jgi:hypothetical protein